MAPAKPKASSSAPKKFLGSRPKASRMISKSKPSKPTARPNPVQVKTKPSLGPQKKKKRVYTDKELGIPALNMITPAGVQKPKNKKKGKVFVDDKESMMTILAMVNAEKEGAIESKMMKARQMEEIREARKAEAEARAEKKKEKWEETKASFKKGKKRKDDTEDPKPVSAADANKELKRNRKRVSFG
ncbi:hypothetical protein K402DRAFT_325916 [Aulographum hederae CBS 113979]|uniref:60S ribosomal subunit assembly/export protein LOC1 n=1 Tax=Aulographum hederae CBS 113979 TaxID=1176131 RepID=A0A6G1HAI5_9PEZI|nr:hypothetical protein K402DRAFT_325916 [Aulographum hederae CBS 113979]